MLTGISDSTMNTRVLLKDLISTPAKAESLLGQLTSDQILAIEDTITRIKRRKLDKTNYNDDNDELLLDVLPTPAASPGPSSPSASESADDDSCSASTGSPVTSATAAFAIATALASAMSSAATTTTTTTSKPTTANSANTTTTTTTAAPATPAVGTDPQPIAPNNNDHHDPVAEIRDGVEWVSFVYSHNRTLRRYNIRTDLHTVSLDAIDATFKEENCVYPRANLPKDQYRGNRWNYETDCNVLGWKLAWLNAGEISGKRGLIQRAVDSYRNRYPSMRSRRVARQEKLMNGTLRKRKNREEGPDLTVSSPQASSSTAALAVAAAAAAAATALVGTNTGASCTASTPAMATKQPSPLSALAATIVKPANHPKTIVLDEQPGGARVRIKINVEGVNLDEIPLEFRKANCVFPRAINMYAGARWLEESLCNELGWRLAWLNQRHLAGKKNMLQRALDVFRTRFIPTLQPRKHVTRTSHVAPFISQITSTTSSNTTTTTTTTTITTTATTKSVPLTAAALSAQNAWYEQQEQKLQHQQSTTSVGSEVTASPIVKGSPAPSCASGTTITLDFGDCLSLAADEEEEECGELTKGMDGCCDMLLCSCADELSTIMSGSSACTPSPPATSNFFGNAMPPEVELYDSFMLPPASDMSFFAEKTSPSSKKPATTISSALGEITRLIIPPAPQDLANSMLLASPSLPSSAVLQQDLVVKMENDDMILLPSDFLPAEAECLFDLF